ncbi:hypothetical protein JCM10908_005657 [Rhodotorula pacifica]|uniref:MFS transporter n=1 Tax=Rhodotorula pacifica TaxID=1495444 RepID=UPI00317E2CC3
MVADIVRDSSFGQIVNWLSNGRYLPYEDQRPGYVIPERYLLPLEERAANETGLGSAAGQASTEPASAREDALESRSGTQTLVEETSAQSGPGQHGELTSEKLGEHGVSSRASTRNPTSENSNRPSPPRDLDAAEKGPDVGAAKENGNGKTPEDYPWLVDFEENDPDRPLNWSSRKRWYAGLLVGLQTLAVYIGSAIYTPAIPGVMQHFGCSRVAATAGLTTFVAAYGIAPIFLSPLQELATWGRNPVYIAGFAIFLVLQIPCVLAPNLATLLVFRFLSSFAGAPCLASGGASMGDLFGEKYLSIAIGAWSIAAICGPILGPSSSSFPAQLKGWQWPFLELIWFGGVVFPLVFFSLPETLESTVLVRRAQRLRKLTGNDKLRAPAELDGSMSKSIPAKMGETIHRAFRLALEPSLLVCHLYTALIYSILYLWFEAFPILFQEIHGFGLGISCIPFLAFIVATLLIFPVYCAYHLKYFQPRLERNPDTPPEARLEFALIAGPFVPISLFWFGWTARASIHWIVPLIGASLYTMAIYILFQQILVYVSLSYPQYAASILAGNTLFRSVIASVFPLFGHAFFVNLGMGPACSLLAGVSIVMVFLIWLIMVNGDRLRARSKFTA